MPERDVPELPSLSALFLPMRRLLTLALLGEHYINASQELIESWLRETLKHDQEPGALSEQDYLGIENFPISSIPTAIDLDDLTFFADNGVVESISDDGSTLKFTRDGVVMALTLFERLIKDFGTLIPMFDEEDAQNFQLQGPVKAFQFLIDLQDCDCQREVIVPASYSFADFHWLIQVSFDWMGYHLWDFTLRTRGEKTVFLDPELFDEDPSLNETRYVIHNANQWTLGDVFPRTRTATYFYDFGDYWTHRIRLEKTINNYEGKLPICVGGHGAAPPEDVGGPGGFANFKAIMEGPDCEDREVLEDWVGENYEPFNLDAINETISSFPSF